MPRWKQIKNNDKKTDVPPILFSKLIPFRKKGQIILPLSQTVLKSHTYKTYIMYQGISLLTIPCPVSEVFMVYTLCHSTNLMVKTRPATHSCFYPPKHLTAGNMNAYIVLQRLNGIYYILLNVTSTCVKYCPGQRLFNLMGRGMGREEV
jgi:hypothetical protein